MNGSWYHYTVFKVLTSVFLRSFVDLVIALSIDSFVIILLSFAFVKHFF